jgi:hypothetical protein
MKKPLFVLLTSLIFLLGCEKKNLEQIKTKQTKNNKTECLPHLYDDQKLEKEKVLIHAEENDSLVFSRNELNKIEKLFPILKAEFTANPEEACGSKLWENYIDQNGKEQSITFSSEVGEDNFCLLYTYYLKQKNGEKKFKKERETLIMLFQTINSFYWQLNYGGTYFGHQYKRLNASAEYSIYQLAIGKEYYEKKYDFQKQKKLYIKAITQYLEDEESQNVYYQEDLNNDRKKADERLKSLKEKIDTIEILITNYFYLNQLQHFEMTYYK